jgi:two-component system, OmpR family, response regulator
MRVLVVDDEADVAAGVERCLLAEGLDVSIDGDGASALERLCRESFDLVILDILLPSVNGFRVCRVLRERDDWTPVLMLTAKCGEYDEAEGLDIGADDFLTKPFSMVVLQARVRALLRRPRRRVDWPAVGELRLDPLRRRCLRGTTAIDLTARETEVLAHLLDHPDVVVSKTALLDVVWGAEFGGDPNIVEVYVRHLRRKIDEPFGVRTIETVRGRGYRLNSEPK